MTIHILIAAATICAARDCGTGVPAAEASGSIAFAYTPDVLTHLQKNEFGRPSPVDQTGVAISPDLAAHLAERKRRLHATRAIVRSGRVYFVK